MLPPELQDGSRVGYIHSAETTSGVNGPGPRYTLFTAGCPLQCQYCHNPDTQTMRMGDRTTVNRVLDEVGRYVNFIKPRGGLTITGGEPLLQPLFVEDIFAGTKERYGLHNTLDTSGMGGRRVGRRLLDNVDLVLLDIKAGNRELYSRVTNGGSFGDLMDFAGRLLENGTRVWIRFVLVPGLTADPADVEQVADICVGLQDIIDRVEILPYHTLGVDKYKALGREYPLVGVAPPTAEVIDRSVDIFRERGLNVVV